MQPTELCFDRHHIPEHIPELSHRNELNFVIGIGGHHAPPHVRLFSYVLPAIELAQKNAGGTNVLTLTTSVRAALHYNYAHEGTSRLHEVYWHTREKIAFIFAFIHTFFPAVFSEMMAYYGDVQGIIPESAWMHIWNEIARVRPEACDAFLRGIGREACDATKAYAVRHAFWFLDFVLAGDTEITEVADTIHIPTVSVGSEKESLFNGIRREVSALPLDFLQEIFGQTILRRDHILQLIFPTGNPIPYGEALKGRNGNKRSAEIGLLTDQSPFDLDDKLFEDVRYTIHALKRLAGATRDDFLTFLHGLKSA